MPCKLLLRNHLSPGDVLVMTAAIESLHRQFPGQFRTAVDTTAAEIWDHNPHISPIEGDGWEEIEMHYPLIHHSCQRSVHFLQGFCDYLGEKLRLPLVLLVNRLCLYISEEERAWMGRVEEITGQKTPYWIVNAGTKSDYTCKQWPVDHYQTVIDRLAGRVQFVQIGSSEHRHPQLRGVIDQVGMTSTRELIRLVWHADGALGPSTFLQHICAAFEKPYICLLGGREPVSWVQYPKQITFHTVGALTCCRDKACWKSRVVALDDGDSKDNSLCEQPILTDPPTPRCMEMISPDDVISVVNRYV